MELPLYLVTNRDGVGAEQLLSFDMSALPLDEHAVVVVNLSGAAASVGDDQNEDGLADAPVDVANDSLSIMLDPRPGPMQTFVASGSLGTAQNVVTYNDFREWDVDYTVCTVVNRSIGLRWG